MSRINLVLDHKATNKTLKLWAFITQVIERTYLADNHSKILLVRSASGQTVSVVTSQNLTRGNRAESSFITTDPRVLGIEPIPCIQDKIDAMISKYRKETIDIEDIEFEEADLELSELFPTIEEESGERQPKAGAPNIDPFSI